MAKNLYFLFIFCLLAFNALQAQDPVFAFAFSNDGKSSTDKASEKFGYKFNHTQSIVDDLIEAKGHYDKPSPKLVMVDSEQKPAWINLKTAEIFVEEKLYDLCAAQGADSTNALAAVLAHELMHYYENHDWSQHMMAYYTSDQKPSSAIDDHMELEIQADQMGGFLAQMAGYPAPGVMSKVLPAIYQEYNLLTESTSLYPSLQSRVEIAEQSKEEIERLSLLFDMSLYLTSVGNYEKAAYYLHHIMVSGKFTSREMYNNLGVLYTMVALDKFTTAEFPYALPLVLDTESRLSRRSAPSEREKILNAAIQAFQSASKLDQKYIPSQLNQISVQCLLGDWDQVGFSLKKLNTLNDPKLLAQKATLEAIYSMNIGEKKKGRKLFKKAYQTHQSDITSTNYRLFSNKDENVQPFLVQEMECQIGATKLDHLFSRIMRDQEKAAKEISLTENHYFFTIEKEGSEILIDMMYNDNEDHIFFQRSEEVVIKNQTLKTGQSKEDIETVIGCAISAIDGYTSSFVTYNDNELIVEYDDEGRVLQFILHYEG